MAVKHVCSRFSLEYISSPNRFFKVAYKVVWITRSKANAKYINSAVRSIRREALVESPIIIIVNTRGMNKSKVALETHISTPDVYVIKTEEGTQTEIKTQLTRILERITSRPLDKNREIIEEKIEYVRTKKSKSITLSGMGLTELPYNLNKLTHLEELNLNDNKLSGLPDRLAALKNLHILNLGNNPLNFIPYILQELHGLKQLYLYQTDLSLLQDWICSLTELELLDISGNNLAKLPDRFGELNNLKYLIIGGAYGGNKIEKFPESIRNLTKLKVLYLENCQINFFPEWIAALISLEELHLSHNKIDDLPASLVNHLSKIKTLTLLKNPLKPELAAAYVQGSDSIINYLRAKAEEQIILNEAKLILVGEGGVGKTSLLGALRGDAWVEDRKTTHGVEVNIKSFQLSGSDKTITFNGWDFGGQAIYRHTHQLFFTAPAVYLAVWEPRRGPEQCAVAEWIKMVKQRAYDDQRPEDRPRVLVAATHGGPTERLAHIDEQALRDEFGALIAGFHHVDSKTGTGMEELKAAIAREAAAIPSIGRSMPKSWKDVLDTLRARGESEVYISYAQFEALCGEYEINKELAATYAVILNELGHIIHYRGHADLQDTVILKAEWLSKAMSYVLEDEMTKNSKGLVEHQHLSDIWSDPARPQNDRYPEAIHAVFLKLMERFDFSCRVAQTEADAPATSLIAQLVPGARPDDWPRDWPQQADSGDSERTRVCRVVDAETGRTVQVEGLMYRLIVHLHRYSLGRKDYCASRHWKTGLILDDGFNGRAFIEQIGGDLWVTVRAAYPERFLSVLCEDVRWLVENFWKGLHCRLSVPCGLSDCRGLIEMQEMFDNLKEEIPKVRCPVCRSWHRIDDKLGATAPRPEFSQALAELKQGQVEIKRGMASGYSSVSTELRRLISQVDEQFATLMTDFTDTAKDGPRLFSLEPMEPDFFDTSDWFNKRFRLTLWCEHSRLPLPVVSGDAKRGVYELELPRDWVKKAAPLLKFLSGTLSLTLLVASTALKLHTNDQLKPIENQLNFGLQCAKSFLKAGDKTGDWLTSDEQTELEPGRQAIHADGAVLRELHTLLKKKDPASQFGGLVRVQNKQRAFLWVHEDFVDEY